MDWPPNWPVDWLVPVCWASRWPAGGGRAPALPEGAGRAGGPLVDQGWPLARLLLVELLELGCGDLVGLGCCSETDDCLPAGACGMGLKLVAGLGRKGPSGCLAGGAAAEGPAAFTSGYSSSSGSASRVALACVLLLAAWPLREAPPGCSLSGSLGAE